MKKRLDSNEVVACVVAVGACFIGFVANLLPDAIFLPLFCRIPAHIASGYYNAELLHPTLIFSSHGIAIQVSRSCGAVTFFSMCASLLLVRLWQRSEANGERVFQPVSFTDRKVRAPFVTSIFQKIQNCKKAKGIFFSGLFVVAAWLLTILVNSARLILIVPVTAVFGLLPERFGASIHMASGMLVFMSAFVILWFLSEKVLLKRSENE